MIDFSNVKSIATPKGNVIGITDIQGNVLWEKPSSGTPPTIFFDGVENSYVTVSNPQVNTTHTKPHTVYVYKDGVQKHSREATLSGTVYKTRFGIGWIGNGSYEIVATDEDGNTSRETFIDNF